MESAALESYRKDVENNRDLTSIAINRKLQEENLAISGGSKKAWQEAQSGDGHTYYWNILTNGKVSQMYKFRCKEMSIVQNLFGSRLKKVTQVCKNKKKKEVLRG